MEEQEKNTFISFEIKKKISILLLEVLYYQKELLKSNSLFDDFEKFSKDIILKINFFTNKGNIPGDHQLLSEKSENKQDYVFLSNYLFNQSNGKYILNNYENQSKLQTSLFAYLYLQLTSSGHSTTAYLTIGNVLLNQLSLDLEESHLFFRLFHDLIPLLVFDKNLQSIHEEKKLLFTDTLNKLLLLSNSYTQKCQQFGKLLYSIILGKKNHKKINEFILFILKEIFEFHNGNSPTNVNSNKKQKTWIKLLNGKIIVNYIAKACIFIGKFGLIQKKIEEFISMEEIPLIDYFSSFQSPVDDIEQKAHNLHLNYLYFSNLFFQCKSQKSTWRKIHELQKNEKKTLKTLQNKISFSLLSYSSLFKFVAELINRFIDKLNTASKILTATGDMKPKINQKKIIQLHDKNILILIVLSLQLFIYLFSTMIKSPPLNIFTSANLEIINLTKSIVNTSNDNNATFLIKKLKQLRNYVLQEDVQFYGKLDFSELINEILLIFGEKESPSPKKAEIIEIIENFKSTFILMDVDALFNQKDNISIANKYIKFPDFSIKKIVEFFHNNEKYQINNVKTPFLSVDEKKIKNKGEAKSYQSQNALRIRSGNIRKSKVYHMLGSQFSSIQEGGGERSSRAIEFFMEFSEDKKIIDEFFEYSEVSNKVALISNTIAASEKNQIQHTNKMAKIIQNYPNMYATRTVPQKVDCPHCHKASEKTYDSVEIVQKFNITIDSITTPPIYFSFSSDPTLFFKYLLHLEFLSFFISVNLNNTIKENLEKSLINSIPSFLDSKSHETIFKSSSNNSQSVGEKLLSILISSINPSLINSFLFKPNYIDKIEILSPVLMYNKQEYMNNLYFAILSDPLRSSFLYHLINPTLSLKFLHLFQIFLTNFHDYHPKIAYEICLRFQFPNYFTEILGDASEHFCDVSVIIHDILQVISAIQVDEDILLKTKPEADLTTNDYRSLIFVNLLEKLNFLIFFDFSNYFLLFIKYLFERTKTNFNWLEKKIWSSWAITLSSFDKTVLTKAKIIEIINFIFNFLDSDRFVSKNNLFAGKFVPFIEEINILYNFLINSLLLKIEQPMEYGNSFDQLVKLFRAWITFYAFENENEELIKAPPCINVSRPEFLAIFSYFYSLIQQMVFFPIFQSVQNEFLQIIWNFIVAEFISYEYIFNYSNFFVGLPWKELNLFSFNKFFSDIFTYVYTSNFSIVSSENVIYLIISILNQSYSNHQDHFNSIINLQENQINEDMILYYIQVFQVLNYLLLCLPRSAYFYSIYVAIMDSIPWNVFNEVYFSDLLCSENMFRFLSKSSRFSIDQSPSTCIRITRSISKIENNEVIEKPCSVIDKYLVFEPTVFSARINRRKEAPLLDQNYLNSFPLSSNIDFFICESSISLFFCSLIENIHRNIEAIDEIQKTATIINDNSELIAHFNMIIRKLSKFFLFVIEFIDQAQVTKETKFCDRLKNILQHLVELFSFTENYFDFPFLEQENLFHFLEILIDFYEITFFAKKLKSLLQYLVNNNRKLRFLMLKLMTNKYKSKKTQDITNKGVEKYLPIIEFILATLMEQQRLEPDITYWEFSVFNSFDFEFPENEIELIYLKPLQRNLCYLTFVFYFLIFNKQFYSTFPLNVTKSIILSFFKEIRQFKISTHNIEKFIFLFGFSVSILQKEMQLHYENQQKIDKKYTDSLQMEIVFFVEQCKHFSEDKIGSLLGIGGSESPIQPIYRLAFHTIYVFLISQFNPSKGCYVNSVPPKSFTNTLKNFRNLSTKKEYIHFASNIASIAEFLSKYVTSKLAVMSLFPLLFSNLFEDFAYLTSLPAL